MAVSWSDHLSQIVEIELPISVYKSCCPRNKPIFKISPTVIEDEDFQNSLKEAMSHWTELWRLHEYPILQWWENLVKPGIKRLAICRSKAINKERRGHLNL